MFYLRIFILLYMSPSDYEIAKIRKQMLMEYLKMLLFQDSIILSCSWKNEDKPRDIC